MWEGSFNYNYNQIWNILDYRQNGIRIEILMPLSLEILIDFNFILYNIL